MKGRKMIVEELIKLLEKQDPKAKVQRGDTNNFGDLYETDIGCLEQITRADGSAEVIIR